PGNFQEAKDMTRWAFELSEQIQSLVMVRSVTRMSHASGNVQFGPLPETHPKARFQFHGNLLDQQTGPVISAGIKHVLVPGRLAKLRDLFEDCPFNTYQGPDQPELLIITSSACTLYSREAVNVLGLEDRVGILKLGTTWPLPPKLLRKHLGATQKIMVVEEVLSFLEDNVKIISADAGMDIGPKTFYGKTSGHIPSVGELNPDLVIEALSRVFQIQYQPVPKAFSDQAALLSFAKAPGRDMTFCPGCPHRASFWSIHNALALDGRNGFVCGDIGCYTMAYGPTGFDTLKTIHSMGSGAGLASGFAKLRQFGMDQPVLAACGDSTFVHAAIRALINAVHHQSDFTLVILDNSGTAMTGFQSHPGLQINAMKEEVPALDIEKICRAVGARVEVSDPFDLEKTLNLLNLLMEDKKGAKVLILRKACALSPERKTEKKYSMKVDEDRCRGANCGCNRLCTRIFKCPGLIWNESSGHSRIDEAICVGCGVCGDICPEQAIIREEN
ncbi:MAG: 4Fe-4S binding protein, partial [Proteobacteria bacterium]|nr:4Fe-4S binding protein [Pseudomonadota bacterium]